MKTAADVIRRIQWDPMLPKVHFVIGYIDHVLGVVEENFTTFSWEDLASVDSNVLTIPQHRIEYFKYKNEKFWDKTERKDIMFGSTGSEVGIKDFMEEVDNMIREEQFYDSNGDEDENATISLPEQLAVENTKKIPSLAYKSVALEDTNKWMDQLSNDGYTCGSWGG